MKKWTVRQKLIGWAIGIVVILGPLFGLLIYQARAAHGVFEDYCQALVQRNYDLAYSLTAPEFRKVTTRAEFLDQQGSLQQELGPLQKFRIRGSDTEGNEDGWSSTIHAEFTFERGSRDFAFVMKRFKGQWVVWGYKEL